MTRVFGKRITRSTDAERLRGRGMYVDDVPAPDALEAVFIRSPYAHARILGVDLEAARDIPGVVAVYSAADLGEYARPLPLLFPREDLFAARTQTPLAVDEVNYVGQIVAMVVAVDRYVAEDAAEQVIVDWEPQTAVVDLEAAAAGEPGLVHHDLDDNVSGRIVQRVGDPDAAFANAPIVLRHRYVLERSAAMPMETRGMVAEWDRRRGALTLWDSTQAVQPLRSGLSWYFDIPLERVRVIAPDTGGGFGVKGFFFYPEEVLVPWASMQLDRRVKWIEDRIEHFTASHHERKQIHDVELAATSDGVVLGLRDRFLLDTGAYVPYGLELGRVAASQIGGPYRIPNIEIELVGVYTNTTSCTPYRGAGRPHTCFVAERALDDLARHVGIDPWEVRRRNFIGDGEFPYRRDGLVTVDGFTVVVDSGSYHRQLGMLEEALDLEGIRERQRRSRDTSKWLGLGMACYVESTGGGPYEGAKVTVEPDTGRVRVVSGFTNQGQSHETTLAQIAAEQLGVEVSDVDVVLGDTETFGWGVATYASRAAVVGGNAVARAATAVRDKALRLAAKMLEAAVEDLVLCDGRIQVKGSPATGVELRHVAKAARPDRYGFDPDQPVLGTFGPAVARPFPDEGPVLPADEEPGLEATSFFSSQNAAWASGAHAAVVEIDVETGVARFLQYVAVHDCGTMINPLVVDGQVIGGVAQGIGGSTLERLAYDADGQLRNASLMDFLMPYATEIPPVELHHLETPSPLNPLGIKGAGEAGAIPVPAVAAAAIEDALAPVGATIREMPLEPQAILELIGDGTLTASRTER